MPVTDKKSQIMSKLPFTIATRRIKYLGIQLKKEDEGPLEGNLETTAQGNKRGRTDGKTFHAYG